MFGGSVPERFEGMVPERCSEEESRKDVWRKSAGKMFGGIVPERCLEEGCRKDVLEEECRRYVWEEVSGKRGWSVVNCMYPERVIFFFSFL